MSECDLCGLFNDNGDIAMHFEEKHMMISGSMNNHNMKLFIKKIIVAFAALSCVCFVSGLGLKRFCIDYAEKVSIWFPVTIFTNPSMQIFIVGLAIFLFEGLDNHRILKGSMMRELLVLAAQLVVYVIAVYLCFILWTIPYVRIESKWGKVISTLGRTELQAVYLLNWRISEDVIIKYEPVRAFWVTIVLVWLYLVFVKMLIRSITIVLKDKYIGITFAYIVELYDVYLFNELSYKFLWVSPASLARLDVITQNAYTNLPDIQYALGFFVILFKLQKKKDLKAG